jgi:ubiquinone/menaquinone biosynthesis C-methylase UbiE
MTKQASGAQTQNDAFRFSGEAAMNYDQYLGPFLFEPYAINIVSKLDTTNVTSVLELACGTGRVTRHLREHFGPEVKLIASDYNADMLHVAESKLNEKAIEFRIEDAQNLSFADNSFDLVLCQFGLMFLKDKKKGLSEALRVLKPGGTFIFSTWDKTENIPLLKVIFNDVILPFFKDEDQSRFLVPFSLFEPEILKTWMTETGFVKIAAEIAVLPLYWPTAKEVVNSYFITHSLGAEVKSKDPAAFDGVAANMEEQVAHHFGETDVRSTFTALFVSGKKL